MCDETATEILQRCGRATKELCEFCDGYHLKPCPAVREVEYHPDGSLKRVVYV